jgi:hypothetical protein
MRFITLGLSLIVAAGCTNSGVPTPTEAVCPAPDPMTLTYDSFGQKFMTDYCLSCHDSKLKRTDRNGAPVYHDYDSLSGVLENPDHIDEDAGSGPAATNIEMPPSRCPSTPGGPLAIDCPKPTEAERQTLAIWIACEIERAKQN